MDQVPLMEQTFFSLFFIITLFYNNNDLIQTDKQIHKFMVKWVEKQCSCFIHTHCWIVKYISSPSLSIIVFWGKICFFTFQLTVRWEDWYNSLVRRVLIISSNCGQKANMFIFQYDKLFFWQTSWDICLNKGLIYTFK